MAVPFCTPPSNTWEFPYIRREERSSFLRWKQFTVALILLLDVSRFYPPSKTLYLRSYLRILWVITEDLTLWLVRSLVFQLECELWEIKLINHIILKDYILFAVITKYWLYWGNFIFATLWSSFASLWNSILCMPNPALTKDSSRSISKSPSLLALLPPGQIPGPQLLAALVSPDSNSVSVSLRP